MSTDAKPKAGLEDTIAISSATCCPDDDRDVLACCGYDTHDLARHAAEKKLNPEVDFYSASTYHAPGIPIDLFTPSFAVSRVSVRTAHVPEQYASNRLIRPRGEYVGPEYRQRYTPLEAH